MGLGLVLLLGGVGLALVVGILWLRTAAGNRFLLESLLPLVQPDHGEIHTRALRTDLFTGATLEGVELVDAEGNVLIAVEEARVVWRLGGLPGRRLVLPEVWIQGLDVALGSGPRCYDVAGLWDPSPEPSAPWSGLGIDVVVEALHLRDTRVAVCAGGLLQVDAVAGDAALRLDGPVVSWSEVALGGVLLTGEVGGTAEVTGAGSWDGHEVRLGETSLRLGENTAALDGRVGLEGDGTLDLTLRSLSVAPDSLGVSQLLGRTAATGTVGGSFGAPTAQLSLTTPGGVVDVSAHYTDGSPASWGLRAETTTLHVAEIVAGLPPTEVHGTFVVSGTGVGWPDELDAHATFAGGSADLDGHGPFSLQADADLADGTLRLGSVRLTGPGGRVTLTGVVDPTAGTWNADVRDSRIDLAELATWGVPALSGTGRFTGHIEGSWTEPTWAEAEGRLDLDRVAWRDEVRVAEVETHVDLRVDGTTPRGTLRLAFRDAVAQGRSVDAGTATLGLEGDHVQLATSWHMGEQEVLGFDGALDLARQEVAANRLHLALEPDFAWDNLGPVAGRWTSDGVEDLHLQVRSGAARVGLDGDLHLGGRHDLRVSIAEFPLASLAPVVPAMAGYAGTLTLDGTLSGTGPDPAFSGALAVTALTVPEVLHGLGVNATLAAADHQITVTGHLRGPEALAADVDLALPFTAPGGVPAVHLDDPLHLRVWLPPTDLADWGRVFEGLSLPVVRASAELVVDGRLVDPEARLVVAARLPVGATREDVEVDLDATVHQGALVLRTVGRQRLARRVEVTGGATVDVAEALRRAGLDLGPDRVPGDNLLSALSVDVVPMQLPVDALRAFVSLPPSLDGSVVGGLHVGGDLARPELAGGLMLIDGHLAEIPLSPAIASLTPGEGGYAADVEVGFGEGGHLHASGAVPFDPADADVDAMLARPGLDLRLDGSAVPVAVVAAFVPGMVEAAGVVAVEGSVTGSLGDPVPDVRLGMQDGAFTLLDTNIRYERVGFTAHLDREAVEISDLSAVTRSIARPLDRGRKLSADTPPSILGGARVALDGWAPASTAADIVLDKAWVADRPNEVLRLSGRVGVTGTWPVLAVKGKVDVDEGKLVLGESFFSSDGSLTLDEDIHVIRPGAPGEGTPADDPGPQFTYALDLRANLNRNVDLDVTMPTEDYGGALTRGLSEIRLAVTLSDVDGLTVKKRLDEYSVVGQVEPVRGQATVLGKDFDISSGTISFTGLDPANPLLDLTAVYPSSYGEITARIQGTAEAPSVSLSIDEPTLSVDDAVAILVVGSPLSMLSGADSTNAVIGLALRSLASAQVAELSQITQFDIFEVDAAGASVGKRLGSRVLLTVGIDYDSAESMAVKAAIEVQLPQRWFFELETSSDGTTRASAYRRWRF